jgi:hypothetical protein
MVSSRRVVTWSVNGRSVIVSDGPAPNAHSYRGMPGFSSSVIWTTPSAVDTVAFGGASPSWGADIASTRRNSVDDLHLSTDFGFFRP